MTAHRRRVVVQNSERFRLNEYLLIVGDQRVRGGSMDRQEAMDAAYECRLHGRLSHDPTPPCGCFPRGEGFGVIEGEGRKSSYRATREAA